MACSMPPDVRTIELRLESQLWFIHKAALVRKMANKKLQESALRYEN